MNRIDKPQPGEYAPYASMYIGLLPDDGLVLRHLRDNLRTTRELILSLPDARRAVLGRRQDRPRGLDAHAGD